jgi:hypothetical protein
VDYQKIIPDLVRHVQDLTTRLEALEKAPGGAQPQ